MATIRTTEFQNEPHQRLPMRKKTKQWKEASVDYHIGKAYHGMSSGLQNKYAMKVSYDLYDSVFDENDFKHITDPYKVSEGFPASLQNFNIIKPKIDLLEGEESKRPFPFKVIQTDQGVTTDLQETYKSMLMDTIVNVLSTSEPGAPITDEELRQIKAVNEYMYKDYSAIAETQAYHTLKYLNEKEDMKTKFLVNFHDFLCANMIVGYVGQINGEPVYERVNPLFFSCDTTPESGHIEDGDWAVRHMRMTKGAIHDRFYDMLTEAQLRQLDDLFSSGGLKSTGEPKSGISWTSGPTFTGEQNNLSSTADVYHVTWRSLKKVGFLHYLDENEEPQVDVVSEAYKADGDEIIEWDWICEIWEGYRIGADMYIGIHPVPNQTVSIDNPNSVTLPYVGTVFNYKNTEAKSLVEIMKPLQYLYIAVMYQLQLTMARDKGKIISVDITQIPKSMGLDANKWMHYLASTNVNFYNPYETQWNVPGREGGKPALNSSFSAADLSMSQVIVQYIQLLSKIEEMIGELSGVSRQRQGQVQSSELVGNVQQTIVQSSHITEYIFYTMTQFKKRVYTNLLNSAKTIWRNSNKEKLHYITDDAVRIFMDVTDEFLYSDMSIFVSDSTKEHQSVEALRSLAQPAMQNGASLSDIAELYISDNLTDMRAKFKEIEEVRQQKEQEMQQQAQQAQQEATQAQMQIAQQQQAMEEAKMQLEMDKENLKSQTSIAVAEIQAGSKQYGDDTKVDIESMKADLQMELNNSKLGLDSTKVNKEMSHQDRALNETIRSNKATEQIQRTAANKPANKSN